MSVSDTYIPQVRTHRPRWRPSLRRQDAPLATAEPDALRRKRLEHALLLSVNNGQKRGRSPRWVQAGKAFLSSFGPVFTPCWLGHAQTRLLVDQPPLVEVGQ